MEMQTTVQVNLDEYKDFIISQYENGKIKKTLTQEVKELKAKADELLKVVQSFRADIQKHKDVVMGRMFHKEFMGYRTRQEQTERFKTKNLNEKYGYGFGFEKNDREILKTIGITDDDMVDYINRQWDEKEKPEAKIERDVDNE